MAGRGLARQRLMYGTAALGVIVLGLASRKIPGVFPVAWGKYPGDALWALMVYCFLRALKPDCAAWRTGIMALGISFAVECGQLYQPPWLTAIRKTTVGHLVLGSHFHSLDLFAYAIGVSLGVLADCWFRMRNHPTT